MAAATLEELVDETTWLNRLARSLVEDAATADDLVQDTYVVAAEHAPGDGRPLRPWLARVLVNLVRMRARSGKRRRARELAVGSLATPPACPEELVARVETQRMLAGLVLELAPARRDVVLLHYFEGLTSVDIGARLELSDGTVRWRLKQALDELRDRLDAHRPNRAWMAPLVALARQSPATTLPVAQIAVAVCAVLLFAALVILRFVSHASPSEAVAARPSSSSSRGVADVAAPVLSSAPMVVGDGEANGVGGPRTGVRIEGRVVEGGVPIEGATVELATSCHVQVADPPAVRSAADGTFAIVIDTGFEYCPYWLHAWRGDRHARLHLEFDPDAPVVLELTADAGVSLTVIDDATGAPIADASIALADVHDGTRVVAGTDAAGRADVARVGSASELRISRSGYVVRAVSLAQLWVAQPAPFAMTARLVAGTQLSGRVVDADGSPVAGAAVWVFHDGDDDGQWRVLAQIVRLVHTDATGTFRAGLPFAGDYVLNAAAPQRRGVTARRGSAKVTVSDPATALAPVTIGLDPIDGTGEVSVLVVDERGQPAAGATVWSVRNAFRPGLTDAQGRFVVHGLAAGCWECGFGRLDVVAQRGDLASQTEPVEADGEVTLRLQPVGIAGVVVDGDGAPVTDAIVSLGGGPFSYTTSVDARGHFAFDVPGGDYTVVVNDGDQVVRGVHGGTLDLRLVVSK